MLEIVQSGFRFTVIIENFLIGYLKVSFIDLA